MRVAFVLLVFLVPGVAAVDEVHRCTPQGCLHVEDDEGDGEPDYAVLAFGGSPLVENADCRAYAWAEERRGDASCSLVDEPDGEVFHEVLVDVAFNLTRPDGVGVQEFALALSVVEGNGPSGQTREMATLTLKVTP